MIEQEQIEIHQKFVKQLITNIHELDSDIADAVNQHFWELYEKYSN